MLENLVVLLAVAAALTVGNLGAQKILPTKKRAGIGRKYIYTWLVVVIASAASLACAIVYAVASGKKLW